MNENTAVLISKHIEILAKRPGMFIESDIHMANIAIHFEGYIQALFDTNKIQERHIWLYWVSLKFKLFSTKWSWEKMIVNSCGSEKESIEILPKLISEFLSEIKESGEKGIINAYDNHCAKNNT
jgi:hypothetical protein